MCAAPFAPAVAPSQRQLPLLRRNRGFRSLIGNLNHCANRSDRLARFFGPLSQCESVAACFLDVDIPQAGYAREIRNRAKVPRWVTRRHVPVLRTKCRRVVCRIPKIDADRTHTWRDGIPERWVQGSQLFNNFGVLRRHVMPLGQIGFQIIEHPPVDQPPTVFQHARVLPGGWGCTEVRPTLELDDQVIAMRHRARISQQGCKRSAIEAMGFGKLHSAQLGERRQYIEVGCQRSDVSPPFRPPAGQWTKKGTRCPPS